VHEPSSLSKRHRFTGEGISHAVRLYSRFLLRYRDVEELLAERGIAARDETIRRWCRKVGQTVADGARRRRARPGDTWHRDGNSRASPPPSRRLADASTPLLSSHQARHRSRDNIYPAITRALHARSSTCQTQAPRPRGL